MSAKKNLWNIFVRGFHLWNYAQKGGLLNSLDKQVFICRNFIICKILTDRRELWSENMAFIIWSDHDLICLCLISVVAASFLNYFVIWWATIVLFPLNDQEFLPKISDVLDALIFLDSFM